MVKLMLLRHGESTANRENVYTGWSDVPLTAQGIQEAHQAGQLIRRTGLSFSAVHTSYLKRAIITANIVMDELDQSYLPIYKTWRLNERHYGALRGQNKEATRQEYGVEQVAKWRRSYTTVPPKLTQPDFERRYTRLGYDFEPRAESLQMALQRLVPYWLDQIGPRLIDHKNQLIVAHGSTLRALIKYLENISDQGIDGVEVANGQPILYTLRSDLSIQDKQILTS
ncbi:2,3-bisphosphoglycerate-dependent phosphoglycerate mutase [Loigolactobacillus backii]|uniref:2,3-bisphosphoglycerate-dependent phosphoglycerate mutase n=1 Tax=Loigolactobacillus backii TaxID=375175 RepID=A0A192H3B5_9LACO|nr:2,3-bisphosphoglycerate-dependent phosphoglycerate mutase [Loigolactobacillus backii]ANK59073.1 phosphoglycerate mutase [Loigolactobacillus backii]ANK62451.1 phosphoglycerate mutase [Loigolactobacillus backii]ANK64062.1 phosphoglycerate mutase [Loigolactobacillus backii]ANK67544.1 phosphoglycerate mutase [Loigolactobacillus backii]ANK70537.1 phosphoglycerate mutase [Loigolactobacillus backii]